MDRAVLTQIFTDLEIPGCICPDVRIQHAELELDQQELFDNATGFVRFGDEEEDTYYLEGHFSKEELLALALLLYKKD